MNVVYEMIQWSFSVAEIFMCYYFCDALMDNGLIKHEWKYLGGWSIVVGTLLDINRHLVFMSYNMIICQCILIFISLIKKNKRKLLCLGIVMTYNVCAALLQLFSAFVLLAAVHTNMIDEVYYKLDFNRILCYLIALSILFGMIIGFRKLNKKIAISFEVSKWVFLIYGVIGLFLILEFQTVMVTYGKSESMDSIFGISLVMIITLVGFVLYYRDLASKAEYKLLELKSNMLETYY